MKSIAVFPPKPKSAVDRPYDVSWMNAPEWRKSFDFHRKRYCRVHKQLWVIIIIFNVNWIALFRSHAIRVRLDPHRHRPSRFTTGWPAYWCDDDGGLGCINIIIIIPMQFDQAPCRRNVRLIVNNKTPCSGNTVLWGLDPARETLLSDVISITKNIHLYLCVRCMCTLRVTVKIHFLLREITTNLYTRTINVGQR